MEAQTKSPTPRRCIGASVIAGECLAMTRDATQQYQKQTLEQRKRVKAQILRYGKPKPKVVPVAGGECLRRADARTLAGLLPQEPPRMTRRKPVLGPERSTLAFCEYAPFQSQHHSPTLPLMSYRPRHWA